MEETALAYPAAPGTGFPGNLYAQPDQPLPEHPASGSVPREPVPQTPVPMEPHPSQRNAHDHAIPELPGCGPARGSQVRGGRSGPDRSALVRVEPIPVGRPSPRPQAKGSIPWCSVPMTPAGSDQSLLDPSTWDLNHLIAANHRARARYTYRPRRLSYAQDPETAHLAFHRGDSQDG